MCKRVEQKQGMYADVDLGGSAADYGSQQINSSIY